MFMPLGVRAVSSLSDAPREYVAWGWAVNGFASVMGAVLATLLSMIFGFHDVLVLGLVAYLIALSRGGAGAPGLGGDGGRVSARARRRTARPLPWPT